MSSTKHLRDVAGPPLQGRDVGVDKEDGIVPGRLSGQGSEKAHRETALPREGWGVVLPVTGGGDEGGRDS